MRISTITNWAYGATILFTATAAVAFIAAGRAADGERAAVETRLVLDDLGDSLGIAAEKRSDEARLFVMRGGARHLQAFRHEERVARNRERALERLRAQVLTTAERVALDEAERNVDELDLIERNAIDQAEHGQSDIARTALFGADHERAQTAVLEPLNRFRALVETRAHDQLTAARERADRYAAVARLMLGLTAALFLGVLYFVLRRRVAVPLKRMAGIVMRLARQDYTVDVPDDRRRDEIGDMTQAIHVFRENGLERERLEAERAAEWRAKDMILQMMHRLQAADDLAEFTEVVSCFVPQTFPGISGHFYVIDGTGQTLTRAGSWLEPVEQTASFPLNACWALRRGRPHMTGGGDVPCPHVHEGSALALCVPLMAQGETIGLLYFEQQPDAAMTAAARLYLELMAENVGLALANIRLRKQLTDLACRDALTGLYNRRCLDETVQSWGKADQGERFACLMIDIDHFKRFNDDFGHEAGDMVMRHVAEMMTNVVGARGDAYRFGGEEFAVLLPGGSEAEAATVAEQMRLQIRAAPLSHRGRVLGNVSISIGVAATDQRGSSAVNLIAHADAALLKAKECGRDRVIRTSELTERPGPRGLAA
jgi:diguanylate cyclase (GGDEF)-like protein